jgi:hypothetical protein
MMISRIKKLPCRICTLGRLNQLRCMGGGGDHDHHGPNLPPFARLRPPTGKVCHPDYLDIL